MNNLVKIDPALLIPMDLFTGTFPVRVDVVYATLRSFCGPVYRPEARLSLHRDMAEIVLLASRLVHKKAGCRMVLYDGLRTTTAQAAMMETTIVKAHPQWTVGETRLLSPPGRGAHPRGVAIDLSLETPEGVLLDMGTPFDELAEGGAGKDVNRAHREHPGLDITILKNRALLTDAMVDAAKIFNRPMLPLPHEWWDFRFPLEYSGLFAPLADEDVPPSLRVTDKISKHEGVDELPASHYEALAADIRRAVEKAYPL